MGAVQWAQAARREPRGHEERACGGDREDAVGVDVKFDLDLGHAPGRRRDAIQPEIAQRLVVPHKFALACSGSQHKPTLSGLSCTLNACIYKGLDSSIQNMARALQGCKQGNKSLP